MQFIALCVSPILATLYHIVYRPCNILAATPETFNCTIWILVLLYIGERSWEKIASDKKSAEIRRNPQKHPIKDPYQKHQAICRNTQAKTPQAKTLAPTVPSHRRLG